MNRKANDLTVTLTSSLDNIFKPRSIAVIGASKKKGSVGFSLLKNILDGGFDGKIYPVNPKYQLVQETLCYSCVNDIVELIDLAVIATPARTVVSILEDCGEKGIGGVIILSAGFKEIGEKGKKMYDEVLTTAKKWGIRIIGPNCVGFINTSNGINASFLSRMALPGKIAFISQSGALCASILDWANDQSVGFSHFVSIGSMVDVDFADLINYFGKDEQVSCILIYMESLVNAEKFIKAARHFTSHKPIIILKAGKSEAGAKAALSHTGSLTGNDKIFDAAFRQTGIIRVETIAQLFNCAQALAMQPRPEGNRLAIVTNAGGPAVLATDYLIGKGGRIAQLSQDTFQKLNELLPPYWSHNNPVDVLGDANAITFRNAVELCLNDKNTDAVLAILTTQDVTDPTAVAKELALMTKRNSKTIFACWMGEQDVQAGRDFLETVNIPHYRYPESAVDVFLKMYRYSHDLKNLESEFPSEVPDFQVDKKSAGLLIESILKEGRYQLMEIEAKQLLNFYQIPTAIGSLVTSSFEAEKVAAEIGFPVVMKIVSPDIGHKTEVGGVILNIMNTKEVKSSFETMMETVNRLCPNADVRGVLVEKMVQKRFELLIGAKKDSIFGPTIVFGMGGVLVELWKDTELGLAPLNMASAKRIIENTKVFQLINGYRGMPKVDMEKLQSILVQFSSLVTDFPELKEVDINPFVIDETGGIALDAHIVLDKKNEEIKI